jgi:hypothetical protein
MTHPNDQVLCQIRFQRFGIIPCHWDKPLKIPASELRVVAWLSRGLTFLYFLPIGTPRFDWER